MRGSNSPMPASKTCSSWRQGEKNVAANKFTGAMRRLRAVAIKEVRQLSRDRVTFGMIVGVPLMQIILFGYAINYDVRNLATVVQDDANSSMSREFVAQLKATQVVHVRYTTHSSDELARLMRHGEGPYSGGKRMAPRRIEIRTLYNPEKRTAVQIVPALIGVILTMTMVVFTASAIVRERERGNLELLIATPLGRLELMVGKLLPYVVIGLIQVTIILIAGRLLFGVPVVGSLLNLYGAALAFIAATLGLGLFVSSLAQTQFQAFQFAFLTMLPSILLSGFMFPFEGMPAAAQWIAQVLPLTHFNVIIRGVMLRGANLPEAWPQLAKLAVFLVVMLSVAVLRFKKRLD